MPDHEAALRAGRGEPSAQPGIRCRGGRLDIRRQRSEHHLFGCPADDRVVGQFASHQRREHHDDIGKPQRRNVGDAAQPVAARPIRAGSARPCGRAALLRAAPAAARRSPASRPRSENCRRRSCAVPIARQMSGNEPSLRDKVNVVVLPGSASSIVCCNRRVNWPTPHCICGPAPRNSVRYVGSEVIWAVRNALAIPARH